MLGTQKGFIVIITYSGISEIAQFQIFSITVVIYHGKILKMPTNYALRLSFSPNGRLLKQWGEEKFPQRSLFLNHVML